MKRSLPSVIVLLSLLLIPVSIVFRPAAKANSDTIVVNRNDPLKFHKIQDAIDYASEGATIFVYVGKYTEHLVINKTLSLIGQDRDLTIIDGNNTGTAVLINASRVSVQGFTIQNTGISTVPSGVYIDRADEVRISHNIVKNSANGISLVYSTRNTISDNIVTLNYYNGIYLLFSGGNVISNNDVSEGQYFGIRLESSSYNIISENSLFGNLNGVWIDNTDSHNAAYLNDFSSVKSNSVLSKNSPANFWDNGNEGNFWNDYAGHDSNSDGIGDIPYQVGAYNDTNNQDRFPLMAPFTNYTINFENRVYSVSVISNSTISDFRSEVGPQTGNLTIRFTAIGSASSTGFCRIAIPNTLVPAPQIVLIDGEEIIPKPLNASSQNYTKLYFVYHHTNKTVTIIYSEALNLYYDILGNFSVLNSTYQSLLSSYSILAENFNFTQNRLDALNSSYSELDRLSQNLMANFSLLQNNLHQLNDSYQSIYAINATYYQLLRSYVDLSGNYSQLNKDLADLSLAYEQHLKEYSDQSQNVRNLTYILAAVTALFIVTTVYLSKRAFSGKTRKIKLTE